MIPSPLRWVGGKRTSRVMIADYLPRDAECYCEVFAGAAWVLFEKKPHPVEVLNDANGDLVNLWRVIKWRPAELLEEVQKYLYSREMFDEWRRKRPDGSDEMDRAVWLYLLIQTSFGAETRSATFGYRKSSPQPLFLDKSLRQFEPAKERLRNVFIEHGDFEKVISRYDQPRTIFYCDPPYLDTCGYEVPFSEQDHERLATTLRGIEGRFLVTVNDDPRLRAMYDGFHVVETEEKRSKSRKIEGRVVAPVLLIANYPLHRSETLPLGLFDT